MIRGTLLLEGQTPIQLANFEASPSLTYESQLNHHTDQDSNNNSKVAYCTIQKLTPRIIKYLSEIQLEFYINQVTFQ